MDPSEEIGGALDSFNIVVHDVPTRSRVPLQLEHQARLRDPAGRQHHEMLATP